MRITNSYILDQPRQPALNSSVSSADQADKQQRIKQAGDSYTKNAASAQIIDAEYVELYSPDTKALPQERQDLHLIMDPETISQKQDAETDQNINSVFSKYQMKSVDVPHPGTYINIFA